MSSSPVHDPHPVEIVSTPSLHSLGQGVNQMEVYRLGNMISDCSTTCWDNWGHPHAKGYEGEPYPSLYRVRVYWKDLFD